MTGPEHYREAEQLLAKLDLCSREAEAKVIAEAQVHATLALAASNVHQYVPTSEVDREGWASAVSAPDVDADPLDNIA
ncbi:hypothetical protein PV677_36355 [Streptomyces sp. DE06-01C]|uniref:hypothetical protein n=1 Tax=Streptomyces sp. DE06-01C TaxID=3028656 RepID=UPI0029C129A1|nr:hypothetical protein [Streptomyces sp. DE06-01C]MDX5526144.1 hypothetical protein [Streptomyces sp. DE06-01C]